MSFLLQNLVFLINAKKANIGNEANSYKREPGEDKILMQRDSKEAFDNAQGFKQIDRLVIVHSNSSSGSPSSI